MVSMIQEIFLGGAVGLSINAVVGWPSIFALTIIIQIGRQQDRPPGHRQTNG